MASRILSFKATIVTAPRWLNDISSAGDNAIFKTREQNIECSFGWVARSAVQHGSITTAIECNGLSLLIFEGKWPHYASRPCLRNKQWLVLGASAFLCPKCDNFACLHTCQDQNELHLKRWFFFAKIGIFYKSIASPLSEALFKHILNHIRLAEW